MKTWSGGGKKSTKNRKETEYQKRINRRIHERKGSRKKRIFFPYKDREIVKIK